MADFEQRSDFEEQLGRRFGRAQREQYRRVIDALGDEPNINNIPAEFWDDLSSEYEAAIRPTVEAALLAYVKQRIDETDIGVDWAQMNERAASWARSYSFELVKGIRDNTRSALQQKIEGFYRDKRTIGELADSISPLFGPVRADMIAVTETTRAAAQGESLFEGELAALGLRTTQVWQTSNDDTVCPICEPLDGKERGDGWGPGEDVTEPPAHIRCRCWINTEVVSAEKSVASPFEIEYQKRERERKELQRKNLERWGADREPYEDN